MTLRKFARRFNPAAEELSRVNWKALASVVVLATVISGCKNQQTQQQPPAQPQQSQSSSSSSSQSQSQSSSSSSSQSSSSSPSTASSMPSPSSPSSSRSSPSTSTSSSQAQPNTSFPSIESSDRSSKQASSASDEGQESQRRSRSTNSGETDPTNSGNPSTPVYSDSDRRPDESRMPPDPSSNSEGEPPDEIDFSEEQNTASSASSSASSSSSSSASSSASSSSASASSSAPASAQSASQSGGQQNGGQSGGQPPSATASAAGPAGGSSAPNEAPTSSAERVAELEGQFESTMASYDGMILREREYVRNRPASAEEQEAMEEEVPPGESLEDLIQSAEAELPAPPPGGQSEGGAGPEQSNSSGQATGPGLPTRGRKGEFDHTGSATVVPADVPTGDDDDVVARQIREAAMRESDPELRERLWEEYRKYKKSQK
ncbi:hypothetical protein [Microbulbifer elongatus]|uniref:hypothetical protein n=1 Tax=Microbulbifer elongatus TaxID=86173 RepID=UPI001E4CA459|nr:hypothetical protein [Microbulbifer elongatus]